LSRAKPGDSQGVGNVEIFKQEFLHFEGIIMLGMDKNLGLVILSFVFCLLIGCATNPITGEEQLMLISEEDDIAIGREYAPEVEKQLGGRLRDEALQNYVDTVGQKIVRVSHRSNWQYHFTVVNHSMVNAMALPGGYIFVTKGILEKITTEAQLAALLAHETVHVVARHSSAAMSQQIGMAMVLQGLGAAGAAPSSEAAYRMAQVALQLIDLKYSRENEREADLYGMDYMVRAGYNPNGAVELMQMLQQQDQFKPVEFFSSHPSPENRILYLKSRIQTRYPNVENLRVAKEEYQKNVLDRLPEIEANQP
jgi:predicted Zn-dependent protease